MDTGEPFREDARELFQWQLTLREHTLKDSGPGSDWTRTKPAGANTRLKHSLIAGKDANEKKRVKRFLYSRLSCKPRLAYRRIVYNPNNSGLQCSVHYSAPKPEIPVPPLQPDGRMEACVLLGTGSSAKRGVFLDVSVNEGAIVDSGHGRLMGDDGALVGVLMAARGRSMAM